MCALPPYEDHIALWANELRDWLPETIFDAHVHLTPPELVDPFTPERRAEALCTFAGLTWEQVRDLYPRLFSTKTVAGLIAFPLPTREVQLDPANEYLVRIMKAAPHVKGFLLSHPTDTGHALAAFDKALAEGVRFSGVKPYFDRLGKSNYDTTMPEFIPDSLLAFMEREELVMMLHTSGLGMCVPENRDYLRRVADRYPRVRIILAHMGRYLTVDQFFTFMDSGLAEHPSFYLGMSSASRPEVYGRVLENPVLHDRLLFGSDLPFGLLTGVEEYSEETGPTFRTRDRYAWSQDDAPGGPTWGHTDLTYNTYHTIKALKDALDASAFAPAEADALKRNVFCDNALRLFDGV